MIVLKQIFHEVGPKTKSRRKVVHDIKKVEKHCTSTSRGALASKNTGKDFGATLDDIAVRGGGVNKKSTLFNAVEQCLPPI